MFRNLLNQGAGRRGLFGGKDESNGDKPPSLPEHLQMTIDIASSMQSVVSMLVAEEEPASKIQEEMEPLHKELVNLLKACIEVNKENDKRQAKEMDSSKFVMDQVQSQLISTKKELTETQMTLQKTKGELQETKDELQQTKKELKEAQESSEAVPENIALGQQQPSLQSATDSADVQLMQSQVESLNHKLEHRQSRIDNLQHILSMKDREHETELNRQKAKAMLGGTSGSDNEDIENLQAELEETREELEQVRDELEQQTEVMIEAEDKLKEADQALENKAQMEDRIDHLSELLHQKSQEVNEIENELEQMHVMMEQTKNIINEQAEELEEKNFQLNAMSGSQVAKPAVDEGAVSTLKEELEKTMDQLRDREDDIKRLKDDLQNTKEIMDIQAQVLQEHKNNPPPPPPPPAQSFDSEEEDVLGKISIEEHMETIQDFQKQLEDAREKIAEQSRQINEQHQQINVAAPWREDDEPSRDDMKQELDIATKRNQRLEEQIEEIEDHLEETMREFEQQAALIQSKDEQIRSLEEKAEVGVGQSRDDVRSTNSSLANEVEDKERIIESLEMQLLEADEAIQELQKEHLVQRKSIAITNDSKREEREAFIESLEMQLEDADTAIRKLETRVREKDKEIKRLEADIEETRQLLEEAQQANEGSHSRGMDPIELEEKDAEIERLQKKLKDVKANASRSKALDQELEEKDKEIARLETKLKDAQVNGSRSRGLDQELGEKDEEIARLEKKLKDVQQKANRSGELDQELEEKEEEIAALQKKLKEVQQKVRNSKELEQELEDKGKEIARLEKKLKDVQAKASRSKDLDQALEDKDQEIARLEKKLKGVQDKTSRSKGLDQELEEKDSEIARLEKKLKDVQERAMSEEEFAEVQKALLHANKSMKKGQKQITKLTEQLEGTEAAMKRELAKAQGLIDEKDAAISSLELKLEEAEVRLVTSQEELQTQAEELEKVKKAMQGMQHETRGGSDESETTINSPKGGERAEKRVSAFGANTEAMTYHELKDRLEVLEQEKIELAAEKKRKAVAMISLQKQLDIAKEEAQKLVPFRNELKDALKKVSSSDGIEAVKSLQASFDRKEMESNANSDKLQEKSIQSLEKEIGLHEKDAMIASLEKELQELTASDKQTKQGSDKSESTVKELEDDLKTRNQTISTLQGKLKELETESEIRSSLEKKLPPGDTRAMGEELIRAQKTISNLQQEIGDLEGNMKQALSALIKDKDSEIKRLRSEFENAAKVVVEKEAEIARLKEQLEENERTMQVVIRSRKDQANESEKMKGRVSGLECELLQAKCDEETKIEELNNTIQMLNQQLEASEESIRALQRKGQQTKRKSLQAKDDTQAEIENLKAKIKTLEAEVNKKNQDKIRITELESQLEREVEQSIEAGRKKQSEIDVLTADLQNANTRIEDLGELIRSEREKRERKVSKDEHRIIDLADRLEQEIDHSESLKKQLDTYKHSLKAKRKIIDSQAHELRDCQDKLDMHDSITRKAKRKMKQLENEIWNLEGELESINMYLRGQQQQRGGFGGSGGRGGRGDPRGMQDPYVDDVPVTQYLDQFSKKVLSARRQLEAAQDKMHRGR
ncbi:unnamed protein product [Cylindrotheca closterium]|uniref:Uncharacterized protein n=1 Tax=Cylindrotheca closterium TaxID=2856 RepID=A0AAD2PXH7_9STRA|nr:unnamed protein product [Cylindrotheca closterium]